MSYKQTTTLLLLVAIVLATTNPPANAQLIRFNLVNASGRLCCATNGNCLLNNTGVPGVTVSVNCATFQGFSVTVGQGITDANGGFTVVATNLVNINALVLCTAIVPLPVNATTGCPVLSTTTTGRLQGAVVPVRTDIVSVVFPNINLAVTGTVLAFLRRN